MLICLDPGHGMGNRNPGVFDPGAVGIKNTREADLVLGYATQLRESFAARAAEVVQTRYDNVTETHLLSRAKFALKNSSDALLSLHFNADATPGDSRADGKVKGFELLWRTPRSEELAKTICSVLGLEGRAKRGSGTMMRSDLAVLKYNPSVLVEFGFIDDPEDYALLVDPLWCKATCGLVADGVLRFLSP